MPSASPPRTSRQLLRDRHLAAVFWGKCGNLIANWALTVITVTTAFNITASPAWTGAVSAAQMAPQLLLTLLSGRLSDSYGEGSLIVVGGLVSGVASLGLAGWLGVTNEETGGAPVAFLVFAFLAGSGMALSAPAQHSIVPRLVRRDELSAAVSLNFLPTALARTVGPAGGAALLAVVGAALAVLVVGLVLVITALAVQFAHLPSPAANPLSDSRVITAIRYVLGDPIIGSCLIGVAAIGVASEPAITLAPSMAAATRGGTAGAVVAAFGAGGAFGVLAHRFLRVRLTPFGEGSAAMCAMAVFVAATSWIGTFWLLLVVMAFAGVSMVTGVTATSIAIQQRCNEAMLGRVMALWVLAFAGVRPIAALVLGVCAQTASLPAALLGAGGAVLGGALVMRYVARSSRHQ